MSNVGITSTNNGYVMANGSALVDPEGVSPNALLEYCQMQLNGLDSQINTMMNQQQQQLNEQEAVQQVQTTLESFGTTGPQTPQDMYTCYQAFQQAEADLPAGDPVIQQLQAQCTQMCGTYQYDPPQQSVMAPQPGQSATTEAFLVGGVGQDVQGQVQKEESIAAQYGVLGTKPANSSWQGTTDAVGNLASDIKSNAQIQMLQLQDLVSQRQDAIEMSTQMMTTEDNTLLDQAKAVGQ